MDFIFGTLATDELKLVHHRAHQRGVQHAHNLSPRDPRPGEPVTLRLSIGVDFDADAAACYYTTDDTLPQGSRGSAANGTAVMFAPVETLWDSLSWGYITVWQAVLPPQSAGTIVRYRISAWSAEREVYADWPDVTATAEAAAGAFFRGQQPDPHFKPGDPDTGTLFTFHVDTLQPPAWAREAIIYQIFVERFHPGEGQTWLQTSDLRGFCGGTLWGVRDKLDYVADLGVNCIWLSPTWVSPSHHGYDVTDYDHVEPRLGGDAALRAVIEGAHQRGIRVLLDLVCNHISDEHPIFKAARSGDPQYRDWFTFDHSEIGYKTFFNVAKMPQVNLAHPPARDWMIGIARRWLREYDVDGYRLDYAKGPGPDFWSDFRAACKDEKPDCFVFGETVDAPSELLKYVGRLDGSLDFHIAEALRKTYAWQTLSEADFERFAARSYAYFPGDFLLPTFLDNHDMDRFLIIAGGSKDALRRAAAVQFRLPAPPIIYYGTEVGLSQDVSVGKNMGLHHNRTPMLWGSDQDAELLAYYKKLIQQRKAAFPTPAR